MNVYDVASYVHGSQHGNLQGKPSTEMTSSREESIQTNIDNLLKRVMDARMQQNTSMEDEAERLYR